MPKLQRHELTGCMAVTDFEVSGGIIKMRVMRADSLDEFVEAMKYYTLYDVDPAVVKTPARTPAAVQPKQEKKIELL